MQEAGFEGEDRSLIRYGSVQVAANGDGWNSKKTPEGRYVGIQAHVPDDTGAFTTLAPPVGQRLQICALLNKA